MEEYMTPPNPYKNPPKSKLNIYELGKYAERVGKECFPLYTEKSRICAHFRLNSCIF